MTIPSQAPLGPQEHLPHGAPCFMCPQCQCILRYVGSRPEVDAPPPADLADVYVCPAGCGTYERDRSTHRLRALAMA